MTGDALDIYVGSRLTATLERDPAAGEYVFSYRSGAQDPVSLTMPVCDLLDRFLRLPLNYEGTKKWLRREDIVSFGIRCCGMDGAKIVRF